VSFKIVGTLSGVEADTTTSNALKVSLYDPSGNALQVVPTYAGIALINIRQSAAQGANTTVWGLYNSSSSKIVYIQSINLQLFFDGTAVATNMKYALMKMTGITTFSGGTIVTPSHKITSLSGAQVSQARFLDTGLTTTGGTAQAAFWNGAQGRVTQTTTVFDSTLFSIPTGSASGQLVGTNIQLAQNEALILQNLVTGVIGDNVLGSVEFLEH
jgi:hypothetical protein